MTTVTWAKRAGSRPSSSHGLKVGSVAWFASGFSGQLHDCRWSWLSQKHDDLVISGVTISSVIGRHIHQCELSWVCQGDAPCLNQLFPLLQIIVVTLFLYF